MTTMMWGSVSVDDLFRCHLGSFVKLGGKDEAVGEELIRGRGPVLGAAPAAEHKIRTQIERGVRFFGRMDDIGATEITGERDPGARF